jgi:hypothetical protein
MSVDLFGLEVDPHGGGVERTRDAKRPRKRPTSLGEIQAAQVGMQ